MITQPEKPLHWAEAFGLSALVHVLVAYGLFSTVIDVASIFDVPEQRAPSLQITSLSVDSATLNSPDIGAGSDAVTTPDVLAPVAEAIAATAPVADSAPASTGTVPERIAPVAPAQPVPADISPLRPETPRLAASPQPVEAPAAPAQPALSPDPGDAAETIAAADLPSAENPATPPPSQAAPPASSAEPDPIATDLINRIRAQAAETCLIALPRQTADGGVSLQVFTATESAAGPFAEAILDGLTPRPPQTTFLVDPRQCAALDYIRQSVGYPTSPMSVGLDIAQIPSGTELTGRISDTGGRNVSLLLVDDNGVVQDLGGYLTVAVNTARFAAPLRRVGAVRDTRQLLIALGTPGRPATISTENGQAAETYFDSLSAEIGGNAALALIPFEVR